MVEGDELVTTPLTALRDKALNSRRVHAWIVDPDGGPYHAMNRGILASHGEWIWFVNAGDLVFPGLQPDRLLQELEDAPPGVFWVAGTAEVRTPAGEFVRHKSFPSVQSMLVLGDLPCHQAVMVRRSAFAHYGLFDTRLKISADYDFLVRLAEDAPPRILDCVLAVFHTGGLSHVRVRRTQFESAFVQLRRTRPPLRRRILILSRALWRSCTMGHSSC